MENVNLLPDNEYTEVEGRRYLNPNLPVERTDAFIDNLRSTQQNNTQQINTDTQRLGTNVPSDLGGLTGSGSYFTSRYQTPQTNSVAQGLRTAARAAALTQALENEQAMWKKRYQDAYRAYQKRQNDKANTANTPQNPYANVPGDDPDYNSEGERLTAEENTLVLPQAETTDTGAVNAINAISNVTGQGQLPTDGSEAGILLDKNGNRTAIKVYRGKGIEVAGGASYNKSGAKKFLSNWVKNGGQVLNFNGGGNYDTNMIYWKLH